MEGKRDSCATGVGYNSFQRGVAQSTGELPVFDFHDHLRSHPAHIPHTWYRPG